MKPLISVIVPVYNGENCIRQCVRGLRAQSYTYLEIIIVNNGSTDNTLELCREMAQHDDRIHVYNSSTKGVSSARNLGLMKATGKYVGFIDADDFIEADMYEYLYNLLVKYQADVSSCNIHYVGSNKIFSTNLQKCTGIEAFKQCLLHKGVFVSVWNKLYTHRCIEHIKFPNVQLSEDFKFLYDVFNQPVTLVCGPAVKYHYDTVYKEISIRDLEAIALKRQLAQTVTPQDKQRFALLKTAYLTQLFETYIKGQLEGKITEYPQIAKEARQNFFTFLFCSNVSFKFKIFICLLFVNKDVAGWIMKKLKGV